MSMYSELSASAQAAYSELYEAAQRSELRRSIASLNGTVQFKSVAGKRYAYFAYRDALDGRVQQLYIGPDSPAIKALQAKAQSTVPTQQALTRQAGAALSLGCSGTVAKHFRIIRQLADARFFRAGGFLIGSHAFHALGNMLGVAWHDGSRTLDIDFAHAGSRGHIAVALPALLDVDVHSAIDALKMGFLPYLNMRGDASGSYASPNEPDLRLDFLTPARRDERPVQDPVLKVTLQPIKFLDYLIEEPAQTLIMGDAGAVVVNIPSPGRFALHKLLVAAERPLSERAKSNKDIVQAATLLDYLLAQAPHELASAWSALDAKGTGWSKRVQRSLDRMATSYPEVHQAARDFREHGMSEEAMPGQP